MLEPPPPPPENRFHLWPHDSLLHRSVDINM